MFPTFEVIPAVDMQDGQVVQLVGGERGTGKRYGDPVDAARRWVEAGAGTLHLVDLDGAFEGKRENPDIVAEISETHPGSVLVSLDAKDGEVVVSGWTEETGLDPAEAAGRYEELGAGGILFTDVDVEGQLDGVRTDPVRRVVEAVDIPVVASGGVATIEDVRALKDAGAAAVVVGSALYEGAFTLEDAMDAVA